MIISNRCLQRLVGSEGVLLQIGQVVVVKDAPPFALRNSVLWIALPPGLRDVPLRRGGCAGALVLGPDRASREKQEAACGQKMQEEFFLEHYRFAPGAPFVFGALGWGCGAEAPAASACATCLTRTSWPSSRESAGFSTIQSVGSRPCKTSSMVP